MTKTQHTLELEVALAEDRLEAYIAKHYGPLWSETNEREVAELRDALLAAYNAAGTPADDRRVDV